MLAVHDATFDQSHITLLRANAHTAGTTPCPQSTTPHNTTSTPLKAKAKKQTPTYLTYIIQNYRNNLPSTIAFLHAHRDGHPEAWHTDATDHDNVKSLRALNIDFVQEHGYANL